MRWEKLGRVFDPGSMPGWPYTHASSPFPEVIDAESGAVRVWFTCRTTDNRSRIANIDFDANRGFAIKGAPQAPVVEPGEAGLFDDSGCAMGCIAQRGTSKYLFYLGWNLKVTVPWLNTIGLAVAAGPGQPFTKSGRAPIIDRSNEDPFSISYPFILEDNGRYRMWYGSNLAWGSDQASMRHVIKHAESDDLLHWRRSNAVHVDLMHPGEYALSRPWVMKRDDGYHMWYSYRGNGAIGTYRIGWATSPDGFVWTRRDDEAGIDVSPRGWDNEMISYAAVFDLSGSTFMLYNGNEYGRTGFGLAQLRTP